MPHQARSDSRECVSLPLGYYPSGQGQGLKDHGLPRVPEGHFGPWDSMPAG